MLTKSQLYQINDFIQWYENNTLKLAPKYQRGAVWTEIAKSYFIDSIMKDYPVPPIFLRQKIDVSTMTTSREIIDGQQRLRAILDFYHNKCAWKKSHSGRNQSLFFKDLTDEEKIHFLNYTLFVNIISQEEDSTIFDMFARLNSNSVVVNKQENRNAKYWGYFKLFIVELGNELRPYFIERGIFRESSIIRMADLEFLNSIAFVCINGMESETASQIDKLYEMFDKEFLDSNIYFTQIIATFKLIFSLYDSMGKNESYLFNKSYMFTLFFAFYSSIYYVKGMENQEKISNANAMNEEQKYKICDKLIELDNELAAIFAKKPSENREFEWVKEFERLHRTRTTSKIERTMRIDLLIKYLNN